MGTYSGLYSINITDFIDAIHPVGSIIKTEDPDFDPNVEWKGVWSKVENKFIVGVGTNHPAGTGGSDTVTLTESNLPSHHHSFTPSGAVSVKTQPTFSGVGASGHLYGYNTGGSSSGAGVFSWSGSVSNIIGSGSGIGYAWYYLGFTPSSTTITEGTFSFKGNPGTTENTGDGDPVNIMPSYRAVNIWERIS